MPSSASKRAPRVEAVSEARCPTRFITSVLISRPHPSASPSATASGGLNPRRKSLRQCRGTGTSTHPGGGARHPWAIHWPKARPSLGNPPYLTRCTTSCVPSLNRNPSPSTSTPARSRAKMHVARHSRNVGHAHRHGGQTPATSLGTSASPHPQHLPRPHPQFTPRTCRSHPPISAPTLLASARRCQASGSRSLGV